jgi:hypothetical protein
VDGDGRQTVRQSCASHASVSAAATYLPQRPRKFSDRVAAPRARANGTSRAPQPRFPLGLLRPPRPARVEPRSKARPHCAEQRAA